MRVRVFMVSVPAMSTIGYGEGIETETGEEFASAATTARFVILPRRSDTRASHRR